MDAAEDKPDCSLLDAEQRVAVDLPCIRCQYNLRTLPSSATCPESGNPILESARVSYLWLEPVAWLKGLVVSSRTLTICLGGALAACLASFAIALVAPRSALADPKWLFVPALLLAPTTLIALVVFTRRDPNRRSTPEGISARRVVRWSATLTLTPVVPAMCAAAANAAGIADVLEVLVFAFLAITPPAVCRYLADLMGRVPRPHLVRYASVQLYLSLWPLLLSPIDAASQLIAQGGVGNALALFEVADCAVFGIHISAFILMTRATQALGEARRRAENLASGSERRGD